MSFRQFQEWLAECGTELEVRRLVLGFLASEPSAAEAREAVERADAWVGELSDK